MPANSGPGVGTLSVSGNFSGNVRFASFDLDLGCAESPVFMRIFNDLR